VRALLRAIKYKEECSDVAEFRDGTYKKVNTKDVTMAPAATTMMH